MCESRDLDPGHDLGKVACYQATPHSLYFLNTYHYLYFGSSHFHRGSSLSNILGTLERMLLIASTPSLNFHISSL